MEFKDAAEEREFERMCAEFQERFAKTARGQRFTNHGGEGSDAQRFRIEDGGEER